MDESLFFEIMRMVILWSSPVIFIVGIFLIAYARYSSFELILQRELGLRKRIIPKLEQNIYSFHAWCLKKNILIEIIFIIYSVVVFLVLRRISLLSDIVD